MKLFWKTNKDDGIFKGLRDLQIFNVFTDKELVYLCDVCQIKSIDEGVSVLDPDMPNPYVLILLNGGWNITLNKKNIFNIPGQEKYIFNYYMIFDPDYKNYFFVASKSSTTQVAFIHNDDLNKLIKKNKTIGNKLMLILGGIISKDIRELNTLI